MNTIEIKNLHLLKQQIKYCERMSEIYKSQMGRFNKPIYNSSIEELERSLEVRKGNHNDECSVKTKKNSIREIKKVELRISQLKGEIPLDTPETHQMKIDFYNSLASKLKEK